MRWDPISSAIDCVFHLPVQTQTLPPFRHTNSFLFGRGEMGMVDAGLWEEDDIDRLADRVREAGGGRLTHLFLTHAHPDHHVGAERIREAVGCRIGAHAEEADKASSLGIDFTFREGDRFRVGGLDLEILHTPGHSRGHCCFLLRAHGVLFTGDHVLGMGTSIVAPPEGDMTLYIRSLERLRDLPLQVICPGHGPLVWDPDGKIREYLEHRAERERAILDAVGDGVRRTEDLVRRVYTDIPESFHVMAFFTAEAHLEKLVREGRVRRLADGVYAPRGHG